MKRIIIGILAIASFFVSAGEEPYSEKIISKTMSFLDDEMADDLLMKNYFAPPYEKISYQRLNDFNDFCSDFSEKVGIRKNDYDLMLKEDLLLSISSQSKDPVILSFINNSGGLIAISKYLNQDLVEILERSQRTSQKDELWQQYEKLRNSPIFKKAEAKFLSVNEKLKQQEPDKADILNNAFKLCVTIKAIHPIITKQESVYGSPFFELNREMRRSELNGAMKSLNKAVKEADKVKELYNY